MRHIIPRCRICRLILAAAVGLCLGLYFVATPGLAQGAAPNHPQPPSQTSPQFDYWSMLFVFALATFIGLGIIRRVSRLLHTPLMSLTNAISAISVVGSIVVTGADYPPIIRLLGGIALFASMTNIVSGFLITKPNVEDVQEAMTYAIATTCLYHRDGVVHLFPALDERPQGQRDVQ